MKDGKYSSFLATAPKDMESHFDDLKSLVSSFVQKQSTKSEAQLEKEYHLNRKAELMEKFKKRFPNGAVIDIESMTD